MKSALVVAAALICAFTASAQTPPHDPSIVFSTPHLHEQLNKLAAAAKEKGSSGSTLGDYGSYKIQLSVRTSSGGAEVHAHWDDVMIVQEGTVTLITGGAVIDPKTNADGETHGTRIENGQSRILGPGDVATVRAGTPHQLIVARGTLYGALVVKVHEP